MMQSDETDTDNVRTKSIPNVQAKAILLESSQSYYTEFT